MSDKPAAVLEFWHSRHYYPPDHKGMAPSKGSAWVRVVRRDFEPGPWQRVPRRSLVRALDAALAAATEDA